MLTGSVATLESATLGDDAVEGVVLRYGSFYGPGTYFAPGGLYASCSPSACCRSPATVAASSASFTSTTPRRPPWRRCRADRIFNVVDDVPAPASEWMPLVAGFLGAKPPRRVPEALARLGAGKFLAYLMCDQPAVSNAARPDRARWVPRYPDWHEGLPAALAPARSATASTRRLRFTPRPAVPAPHPRRR